MQFFYMKLEAELTTTILQKEIGKYSTCGSVMDDHVFILLLFSYLSYYLYIVTFRMSIALFPSICITRHQGGETLLALTKPVHTSFVSFPYVCL